MGECFIFATIYHGMVSRSHRCTLLRQEPFIYYVSKRMCGWMGGWVQKRDSFAVVQYRIYADKVGTVKVGGSEKVQNYADIIYGWSLVQMVLIGATHSSEKTVRAKQRLQRPGQKFEFESGESATFKNWWGQAYVICPFQQCTYGTPNAHPITQSLKQVVDSDFVRDWG